MAKLQLNLNRKPSNRDPHHVPTGSGDNCGRCVRLTDFHKDKQSGWCVGWSKMMSSALDVSCSKFSKKQK